MTEAKSADNRLAAIRARDAAVKEVGGRYSGTGWLQCSEPKTTVTADRRFLLRLIDGALDRIGSCESLTGKQAVAAMREFWGKSL